MGTATSRALLPSSGEKGQTFDLMASSRLVAKGLPLVSGGGSAATPSRAAACGRDGLVAAISDGQTGRPRAASIGPRSGKACEIATISRVTMATSDAA